jgi:hypothetical protein
MKKEQYLKEKKCVKTFPCVAGQHLCWHESMKFVIAEINCLQEAKTEVSVL